MPHRVPLIELIMRNPSNILKFLQSWNGVKVLRHVDYRFLWFGSLTSFIGSQIQNVAQGYFVFELTGSNSKLAFITFCGMIPITLFGPIVAVTADLWDRRKTLIWTSIIFSVSAIVLAVTVYTNTVQYWIFIAIALITGFVQTIEQPTRQSIVRAVVPREDLSAAIPMQGMTFNLARTIGPAIGGIMIATLGTAICFLFNAISYIGVLFAATRIKTDLTPAEKEPQPIRDLIFEGMLYTLRHRGLRTLFIMEGATSLFGIFYLSQLPAIAKSLLNLGPTGLGLAYSAIGVGAMSGLISLATFANRPWKPKIIRIAMSLFAIFMYLLSINTIPILSFALFACLGIVTMAQFNTTNTLFQLIAPARLQGRVLAMHMWAVGGLAPVGALIFGMLADYIGLRPAMTIGAVMVGLFSIYGWTQAQFVEEPTMSEIES